jgi:hypothetical protein
MTPYTGEYARCYVNVLQIEKLKGKSDNVCCGATHLLTLRIDKDEHEAQFFNARNDKLYACLQINKAARRFWRDYTRKHYGAAVSQVLARNGLVEDIMASEAALPQVPSLPAAPVGAPLTRTQRRRRRRQQSQQRAMKMATSNKPPMRDNTGKV